MEQIFPEEGNGDKVHCVIVWKQMEKTVGDTQ